MYFFVLLRYFIYKSKKLSYLPISVGGSSALFVGYFPIKSGKATAIGLINILMIKKIADIYGIPVLGDTVSDIFQNTFKECFFSTDESFEMPENLINLLTLFNAGGVVSGVSAAAVTASIGLAYSYIAEYRCKSMVDPKLVSYKDFQEQINNIFNNNLNEEELKIFKKSLKIGRRLSSVSPLRKSVFSFRIFKTESTRRF